MGLFSLSQSFLFSHDFRVPFCGIIFFRRFPIGRDETKKKTSEKQRQGQKQKITKEITEMIKK